MGKEYEAHIEVTVPAAPGQVWEAIATGPGVSSWYIGRTEIDESTVRTVFGGGAMPASDITAADEPERFAFRTPTADDGRFQAFEFLVEGREQSGTVLRVAAAGFLPGDDWADEYEAMSYGLELFFATLVQYLNHFPGRAGTPVTVFGPPVDDWTAAWDTLHDTLGLSPSPKPGDIATDGSEVFFANPHTLALRTREGLFRYIRGLNGTMIAAHVIFPPADAAAGRWQAVLDSLPAR
jgi:uncharacterized protein YndB with AHSA1/START domain